MNRATKRKTPPLPHPAGHIYFGAESIPGFSSEQMYDFAIAAIEFATGAEDPANYPSLEENFASKVTE